MAPYDIPAGSEYAEVLYDALVGCSCLVLMLTDVSQNSQWVKKEVNIAITNGKTVIPVKLEDVELNSSMKLYLNDQQIVPVHVVDERSENVQKVLKSVILYTSSNINDILKQADKSEKTIEKNEKKDNSMNNKARGVNSLLNERKNSPAQLEKPKKKDKEAIPARQSFGENFDENLESQCKETIDIFEFKIDLLEKDKKSKDENTYDDLLEEYCGEFRTSKTLKSKSEYSGLLLGESPEKFVGKRVDGRYKINEITNEKSGIFIYKAYDNVDCRDVNFYVFSDAYYTQWKSQKLTKKKIKKKILQMIPKLKYNDKCLVVGDIIVYMVRNYDMLDDFAGADYFLEDMVTALR